DLRNLDDGSHAATFLAPDVSEDPIGPGFPANPNLSRIWRPLSSRVEIKSGAVVRVDNPDLIVVSGSRITVHLQPAWLRSPLASARPAPPDMIVIHHTAGNLQGDLDRFLYSNEVSIHYLVGPNGDVYKLVREDRAAAHAGFSHWQGRDGMNARSIGIE